MNLAEQATLAHAAADLNLDPYWMPFTHNRYFKKHQPLDRLLAGADGAYYTTVDGQKLFDCLSGLWVNREAKKRPNFLEAGDIDAALTTASAIGDDTLQRQAQGRVVPDSFTHGSAAQRKQWFMNGYQQGTLEACNTFASGASVR